MEIANVLSLNLSISYPHVTPHVSNVQSALGVQGMSTERQVHSVHDKVQQTDTACGF